MYCHISITKMNWLSGYILYVGVIRFWRTNARGVLHSLKSRRWPQKSMMKFEIRFHWFRIFLYLSVNPNVKLACSITRDANSFNFIIGVQETTQDLKKASALIQSRDTWPTMHRRLYIENYYRGVYNIQSDKRLYARVWNSTRMAVQRLQIVLYLIQEDFS